VIVWNLLAVIVSFLNVGAWAFFARQEQKAAAA
jgi:hypothetical protein